jgi:hypothetical protein
MTRNDTHELHTLSPTDPATEHHAAGTAIVADADIATSCEPDPESAADPDDAPVSLAMRVLAWLPLRVWTDCGVCLFWRGAVVGAFVAGVLAMVVSVLA